MWEYLFLLTTMVLAILLTFPKKSAIRRVITTTPILLKNMIKTKSITPYLKSFVHNGHGHGHGGDCCKPKEPDMEQIRLFQHQLHTKMNHEKMGNSQNYGQHSPHLPNRSKSNASAIMLEIPVEDDELD